MQMSPAVCLSTSILPAIALLGPRYTSREAQVMLLANALQESGLRARHQAGAGPAHGLWQFELIGCRGVLEHPASDDAAARICRALLYKPDPLEVYAAIEYADVLAAAFARLALWRLPQPLPALDADPEEGWRQYLQAWGPGKPHRERWNANWFEAVEAVLALNA